MKKLYFFLAVFLLALSVSSAQQVKLSLSEGAYPVNRVDSIVWIDLSLSNSEILKEMIFDVILEFVDGASAIAHVIPARPVLDNGQTDQTKWTQVAGPQFKYWMDQNIPANFLAKSEGARKIMEFFIKFDSEIPNYGAMIIKFTNFRILGVDGNNTIDLTGPSEASIRIEFGQRPPDERPDSVKLNLYSTLDKPRGELKLTLAYLSKYSLGQATLDLSVPSDFLAPQLLVPPAEGRTGQLQKTSSANGRDYYELVINSRANPYPISAVNYVDLAEIMFTLPPEVYGLRQVAISNLSLTDGVGVALKTEKNLYLSLNLGQAPPPPVIDSLYLRADYVVDRVNSQIIVNLAYWGSSWDTLEFNLNVPRGLSLREVLPALLSTRQEINGSQIKIISRYHMPKTRPLQWHHFLRLIFDYRPSSGVKKLTLNDITAQREDTVVIVVNRGLTLDIDFDLINDVEDRLPNKEIDIAYVCGFYLYYQIFSANWELSIYDYMGRPLKVENGQPGQGSVNLEDMKNGLYFYRLKIGDRIINNKFFIY